MPSSNYVFVSYARRDKQIVDRLAADLRTEGVEIWRDVDEILPGQNWEREITGAVGRAVGLLFVASQHSRKSTWMGEELKLVLARNAPVIPLILDDAGEKNLPEPLKQIQWIDFRVGYDAAFKELLRALPTGLRGAQPVPARVEQSKGYVFVNYAEEDSDFVGELKSFLKSKGYAYWDYEESDRDYHTQLFRELEHVILDSAAVLSVISPAWKDSDWAPREYIFSRDSKIPAFLLMARETPPILIIAGDPYIDFVKNPNAGFERLGKELQRKGL